MMHWNGQRYDKYVKIDIRWIIDKSEEMLGRVSELALDWGRNV